MRRLLSFVVILSAAILPSAHALTMDELMSAAVRSGKSSGELTGVTADSIRAATRSTAPTHMSIERVARDAKCQTFRYTLTQPQIPSPSGGIVGDYVTVSESVLCSDDREQAPPKVVSCHIGGISCLAPAPAGGAKFRP